MEWQIAGLIILGGLILLLLSGMPIGFAVGVLGVVGLLLTRGVTGVYAIATWSYGSLNDFVLTALPLFVLIAAVASFANLSDDVFTALEKWLRRVPAGLSVATIGACAGFAAASGSSVATAATMGTVAIPEMMKRGYNPSFATGTVAAGGTLGILIPPSIPMIIFAVLTEQSIGRLFIAGFIPGLILAGMFAAYAMIAAKVRPSLAPPSLLGSVSWKERIFSMVKVLPLFLVALSILGTMYTGIATPTESAGIGVGVVLLVALAYRRLTWSRLSGALSQAVLTTTFILMIIIGMTIFAYLLADLGVPKNLARWITGMGLSKWLVLWAFIGVYTLLGMFMDVIGILMLTTPVFFPVIVALGFDPIWFGVLLVINLEVSLLTPPVGLNVYVLKGIADPFGISMAQIFRGIVPFVFIMYVLMVLLMLFPWLALWLPNTMF